MVVSTSFTLLLGGSQIENTNFEKSKNRFGQKARNSDDTYKILWKEKHAWSPLEVEYSNCLGRFKAQHTFQKIYGGKRPSGSGKRRPNQKYLNEVQKKMSLRNFWRETRQCLDTL